jgi:hypothetical protein
VKYTPTELNMAMKRGGKLAAPLSLKSAADAMTAITAIIRSNSSATRQIKTTLPPLRRIAVMHGLLTENDSLKARAAF